MAIDYKNAIRESIQSLKLQNSRARRTEVEELLNFSDAEGWIGPIASEKLYRDFVDNEKQIMDTVDKWVLMKGHPDYTPAFLQRRQEDQFSSGTADYTLDDVSWFRQKYQDWKKAFELASNNGAVIFH